MIIDNFDIHYLSYFTNICLQVFFKIQQQKNIQYKMYSNQTKKYASQLEEFLDKKDWNLEYYKQSSKYQTVQQRIEKLRQLKTKLRQKAKANKNIGQYKQGCKLLFSQFLKLLDFDNFKNGIAKPQGVKYYLVIGPISAGKSSFINYYFDANENVGVGETTSKPRVIKKFVNRKEETVYIWETPCKNQQFNTLSDQMLKHFAAADKIFLLSSNGTNAIMQLASVILKLNSNILYYIRTHCDQWNTAHKLILQQMKAEDRVKLLDKGIICRSYYQVGSLKDKRTNQNIKLFDNEKNLERVKRLIQMRYYNKYDSKNQINERNIYQQTLYYIKFIR